MKEFGETLKLVLGKVVDFFGIFDLSFFISGITGLAAVTVYIHCILGLDLTWLSKSEFLPFLVVLTAYIMGLCSFALGRLIREIALRLYNCFHLRIHWSWVSCLLPDGKGQVSSQASSDDNDRTNKRYGRFGDNFCSALAAHGLDKDPRYIQYKDNSQLYVRFWADLRQSAEYSPSLSHLQRSWVMAATYDGLTFSLSLWLLVLCFLESGPSWVVIFIVACLILITIREAGRYTQNQVEELIATIASMRRKDRDSEFSR